MEAIKTSSLNSIIKNANLFEQVVESQGIEDGSECYERLLELTVDVEKSLDQDEAYSKNLKFKNKYLNKLGDNASGFIDYLTEVDCSDSVEESIEYTIEHSMEHYNFSRKII